MKLRLKLRRAARKEFDEAIRWYETRQSGLGGEFINEVEHAFQNIAAQPDRYPVAMDDIRIARVRRFPYSLYYRLKTQQIVVLAVFHSSRDPAIWQSRK
jgi:plasmid stabilization system protein ParE